MISFLKVSGNRCIPSEMDVINFYIACGLSSAKIYSKCVYDRLNTQSNKNVVPGVDLISLL